MEEKNKQTFSTPEENNLSPVEKSMLKHLQNDPTPKSVMLVLSDDTLKPQLKAAALEAARKLGLNKK